MQNGTMWVALGYLTIICLSGSIALAIGSLVQ